MATRRYIDEIDVLEIYKGVDIVSIGDDGVIEIFTDDSALIYDPESIV